MSKAPRLTDPQQIFSGDRSAYKIHLEAPCLQQKSDTGSSSDTEDTSVDQIASSSSLRRGGVVVAAVLCGRHGNSSGQREYESLELHFERWNLFEKTWVVQYKGEPEAFLYLRKWQSTGTRYNWTALKRERNAIAPAGRPQRPRPPSLIAHSPADSL